MRVSVDLWPEKVVSSRTRSFPRLVIPLVGFGVPVVLVLVC